MEEKDRRTRTAHHESGHAVVAVIYGHGIDGVEMGKPGEDVRGRLLSREADDVDGWRKCLLVALAGPLTDAIYCGKSDNEVAKLTALDLRLDHGAAGDWHNAVNAATRLLTEARAKDSDIAWLSDILLRKAIQHVIADLHLPPVWNAVEEMAERLLSAERLTEKEVFDITREVPRLPLPEFDLR
jgi:hypothetical protein